MKKIIVVILALVLCFALFGGCSNSKGTTGNVTKKPVNSGLSSETNEKATYTFTEYLSENGDTPLLFFSTSNVTKSSKIYHIYVFQNGKAKMYPNYGDKTLGDYAKMSDAEILTYLENEWEKEFCIFVQKFIDDTAWPARFRSGEATIYVKGFVDPQIELITDDTGNDIDRQMVYLPREDSLTLDLTVWYKNHMWNNTTDYDYVVDRNISAMTDAYCFNDVSRTYEIYSSRYIGLAPAPGGYGLSRYLLTRSANNITITLDKMDSSVAVDLDYMELQDLAYSFYEQYRKNYQSFAEVSKRFTSLKLPDTPEMLRVGYTEFDDFCYVDADGKLTGYDIELIQKLCNELGVATDFISFSSVSAAKEELNKGSIDCLVGGLIQEDISDFYVIDSRRVYYYNNSEFQHCGLAFRKDLDGVTLFSQACDKFGRDGTIGSLLNKYRHAYAKD